MRRNEVRAADVLSCLMGPFYNRKRKGFNLFLISRAAPRF
jgi:hypothetical protein